MTAALSGLAPNTTYHYRLVTAGCAPIGCSATTGDQSFTTGLSVTPAQGSTVGVVPVGGTVLLKLSGKRKFARLTTGELVPVGSTIDARKGQVLIESAVASVSQQVASGLFNGGIFTVTQPAGATTTVLKLDSSYKRCAARSKHRKHSARIASAKRKPSTHKVVNQVFGTAHGQYTTRGHYAAAADEGTSWHLADRCDGTYVAVSVGQVDVTNLVTGNSFPLNVGQHYLAKPH